MSILSDLLNKELSMENYVGVALSSNILGAIFGGLIEYNSMYFGFKSLYLLGIIMYLIGYIFSKKIKLNYFKGAFCCPVVLTNHAET